MLLSGICFLNVKKQKLHLEHQTFGSKVSTKPAGYCISYGFNLLLQV